MFGAGSFNEFSFEDAPRSFVLFSGASYLGEALLGCGVSPTGLQTLLAQTKKRLVFAAEISPFTVSR